MGALRLAVPGNSEVELWQEGFSRSGCRIESTAAAEGVAALLITLPLRFLAIQSPDTT